MTAENTDFVKMDQRFAKRHVKGPRKEGEFRQKIAKEMYSTQIILFISWEQLSFMALKIHSQSDMEIFIFVTLKFLGHLIFWIYVKDVAA